MRFRDADQGRGYAARPPNQVMDLKMLLQLAKDRLSFLGPDLNERRGVRAAMRDDEGVAQDSLGLEQADYGNLGFEPLRDNIAEESDMRYARGQNDGRDFERRLAESSARMLQNGTFMGSGGGCLQLL